MSARFEDNFLQKGSHFDDEVTLNFALSPPRL